MDFWDTIRQRKYRKQIASVRDFMRDRVRARKCVHVYNRIKTGRREEIVLLSPHASITTFLRVLTMVKNVSRNTHCIYDMHWQNCRRKFVKWEQFFSKKSHSFLSPHNFYSSKRSIGRQNIIDKNYICVTTPKNRSVLWLTLVWQLKYRIGWTKM